MHRNALNLFVVLTIAWFLLSACQPSISPDPTQQQVAVLNPTETSAVIDLPTSDPRPAYCTPQTGQFGSPLSVNWLASDGWDLFAPDEQEKEHIQKTPGAYKQVKNRSLNLWLKKNASVDRLQLAFTHCSREEVCVYQGRDHDYASGELFSETPYPAGRFESSFQAARGSGLVTAMFTYSGEEGQEINEIDIEILGKNPTEVQLNYWIGPDHHEKVIRRDILGKDFDAAKQAHDYAIEWNSQAIYWYINGKIVHCVFRESEAPWLTHPMRLMFNLWASNSGEVWAGSLDPGQLAQDLPITVDYDHVTFRPEK